MKQDHPPARLPAEFGEIWHALRDADERAPSRQVLARRLGVSTHTIQRILVDGDVPSFATSRNARVIRSWARTLTRLAHHFGKQPRTWIEGVGIPWDKTIERAAASALRPRREGALEPRRGERAETAAMDDPSAVPGPGAGLVLGLVGGSPLARPLPGSRSSFLETFGRRLVGAVRPLARVGVEMVDERSILSVLNDPKPAYTIGVGVLESVARRESGLTFLSIPGWWVRLAGICVCSGHPSVPDRSWQTMVANGSEGEHFFLVREADIARDFLAGQCDIPLLRMLVRTSAQPADLAADLVDAARRHPDHPIVLVSDESTCRDVFSAVRLGTSSADGLIAEELVAEPQERPGYPLSIAIGRALPTPWLAQLERALKQELFGSTMALTARLYASQIVAAWRRGGEQETVAVPSGAAGTTIAAQGLHPWGTVEFDSVRADFSWANAPFRHAVSRCLLQDLSAQQAGVLLARLAQDAVPVPPQLAAAEQATHVGRIIYCRSCSASLLDEHNRGSSEIYCRYCSDAQGRLRSRDDVRRIIAQWFVRWQGTMPQDEALRRADLYMQALPAWNKN